MPSTSDDPRPPFLQGFKDGRPDTDTDVVDAEVVEPARDGVGRRMEIVTMVSPFIGEAVQYTDVEGARRAALVIAVYGSGLTALQVFQLDRDPVQYRAVGFDSNGALNSWRRVEDARG